MIDLHSHLLPGIDDGAPDLDTSLEMARIAVEDGIAVMACTPHIYPGMFENNGPDIKRRVAALQAQLNEAGINLELTWGADAHVAPDLMEKLKSGAAPSLNDTRYFLLEPPHHVAPPKFAEFAFGFLMAGYVPVITHPERLSWIGDHYQTFCDLSDKGVWMQVTAGSLTGRFGQGARYWGERMLDEGRVHILATDAHSPQHRPPMLAEGREAATKWVGKQEAQHLVETRPLGILKNYSPVDLPPIPGAAVTVKRKNILGRLFGRGA